MRLHVPLAAALACAALPANASCGSAYCVVNTDWGLQAGQHSSGEWVADLRYEFIDQKRLWSGSHKTDGDPNADALEQRTLNSNLLATIDHTLTEHWGVRVDVPVVSRIHDHIADPSGAAVPERWSFTRLGDARVVGRYQFGAYDGFGLNAGLKLPTGSHTVANDNGTPAERMLQPGSGTTDAIAGLYFSGRPHDAGMGWFAQVMVQHALNSRDEYRPGDTLQATAGLRLPLTEKTVGTLQVNYVQRRRDSGANAEPDVSGNRSVFLSPGISIVLSPAVQVYGFLQLPLYRYVNGVQLTADRSAVVGVSLRF